MNNDFDIRDGILYKYNGSDQMLVIPSSVHTIREKAFRFCSTIISIEIPDSVTTIEWGAFSFCNNLEQLIIPPSVKFISVSAIEGCANLKSIIINDNKCYYTKDNKIFSVDDESVMISTEIIKQFNTTDEK